MHRGLIHKGYICTGTFYTGGSCTGCLYTGTFYTRKIFTRDLYTGTFDTGIFDTGGSYTGCLYTGTFDTGCSYTGCLYTGTFYTREIFTRGLYTGDLYTKFHCFWSDIRRPFLFRVSSPPTANLKVIMEQEKSKLTQTPGPVPRMVGSKTFWLSNVFGWFCFWAVRILGSRNPETVDLVDKVNKQSRTRVCLFVCLCDWKIN